MSDTNITPPESSAEPGEGGASPWNFAGWGSSSRLDDLAIAPRSPDDASAEPTPHHKLGVWSSTAICGNDITSSCLYVAALAAAQAGKLAPVVLALVAGVLFLFRRVYAEVGSALPLNGGTYTVLLNTTNKRTAAGAAVLTLLSYVATAVISASEAMHYAHNLWHGLDVFWATVGLLGLFAALNVIGITESAVVALAIFIFHMITLSVLVVVGTWTITQDPSMLQANWAMPTPGGFAKALFFGFAAAMLGISGFESSANFIEEQADGVFPKTLRNMWAAVAIFNPAISLLSLGLLPLVAIAAVPPDLLAQMADKSAGAAMAIWVSVDAVLVLSGAVLTSFVGVTGLVRRMSLDRCLPQVLLAKNVWRSTNHWIIIGFFVVCVSILMATAGEVSTLAGVYTISFLAVMSLFAVGNMLLKVKRAQLPRSSKASWPTVSLALLAVLIGLVGNIMLDPTSVRLFLLYFVGASAVVGVMFLRVQLLRGALFMLTAVAEASLKVNRRTKEFLVGKIHEIRTPSMIYFAGGDDPAELNRAALYVLENEQTHNLTIVHVYADEAAIPPHLAAHLADIDKLYPELKIDFVAVKGVFEPELIEALSKRLSVPTNYMFIGTPGDRFPHRIERLGGVRLIL